MKHSAELIGSRITILLRMVLCEKVPRLKMYCVDERFELDYLGLTQNYFGNVLKRRSSFVVAKSGFVEPNFEQGCRRGTSFRLRFHESKTLIDNETSYGRAREK